MTSRSVGVNGLISSIDSQTRDLQPECPINGQAASGGLKNRIHTGWISTHVGVGLHGDDARFLAIGRVELERVLAAVVLLVSNDKTLWCSCHRSVTFRPMRTVAGRRAQARAWNGR